jgi:hypothetical protein
LGGVGQKVGGAARRGRRDAARRGKGGNNDVGPAARRQPRRGAPPRPRRPRGRGAPPPPSRPLGTELVAGGREGGGIARAAAARASAGPSVPSGGPAWPGPLLVAGARAARVLTYKGPVGPTTQGRRTGDGFGRRMRHQRGGGNAGARARPAARPRGWRGHVPHRVVAHSAALGACASGQGSAHRLKAACSSPATAHRLKAACSSPAAPRGRNGSGGRRRRARARAATAATPQTDDGRAQGLGCAWGQEAQGQHLGAVRAGRRAGGAPRPAGAI